MKITKAQRAMLEQIADGREVHRFGSTGRVYYAGDQENRARIRTDTIQALSRAGFVRSHRGPEGIYIYGATAAGKRALVPDDVGF